VRFNDTITILSKETRASTNNSQDFFFEDTSNIVLVRLTGEDNLIDNIITLVLNETKVLPLVKLDPKSPS